jgi:hypothetical protein
MSTTPDTGVQAEQSDAAAAQSRVIVNTNLTVEVGDLRDAYASASGLARAAGGYVAESRITTDDDAKGAFLRLRVPAEQHDGLLNALRGLSADVASEQTNAREVSAEYTDLQSRLVNLQRAEEQYQTLLGRAGSIDEILKVTAKLDSVRGEIEQVQGRANLLASQSDFATIALTLSLPAPAPAPVADSGLPSPARVFVDAGEASLTVAHGVLNVVAVLAVVVLWAIPALAVFVVLRRPVTRVVEASRRRLS